jgi:hypothetical protein
MTDVEIGARALIKILHPDAPEMRWGFYADPVRRVLEAVTADGRAKIVRREPTREMIYAAGSAFAAHGGAVGALCAAYDAAPAFSDQDKAVPVKIPERPS